MVVVQGTNRSITMLRRYVSKQFSTKNMVKTNTKSVVTGEFDSNPETLPSSSVPQSIFKERIALIYKPARNVMQSGRAQTHKWLIQFNPDVPRWENPVMGWTSSRDPVQGMNLKFESREDAVKYAQEQGWAYEVKDKEGEEPEMKPKSYAENFLYSAKKLKIIKTK